MVNDYVHFYSAVEKEGRVSISICVPNNDKSGTTKDEFYKRFAQVIANINPNKICY